MSKPMLPSPGNESEKSASGGGSPHADRSADREFHDERGKTIDAEFCVEALHHLAGLVALGIVTPAKANSIRGAYRDILQYRTKQTARHDAAPLSDNDIMALARTDPKLLNMLAPVLTAEQIDMVLREGGKSGG